MPATQALCRVFDLDLSLCIVGPQLPAVKLQASRCLLHLTQGVFSLQHPSVVIKHCKQLDFSNRLPFAIPPGLNFLTVIEKMGFGSSKVSLWLKMDGVAESCDLSPFYLGCWEMWWIISGGLMDFNGSWSHQLRPGFIKKGESYWSKMEKQQYTKWIICSRKIF